MIKIFKRLHKCYMAGKLLRGCGRAPLPFWVRYEMYLYAEKYLVLSDFIQEE